jgi:hypothetical protein
MVTLRPQTVNREEDVMAKSVRSFDYVNHPYEAVRDALSADAPSVFRAATKAASQRAYDVASALHVAIGGVSDGTDIDIEIKSVKEHPRDGSTLPETRIELEWAATKMTQLFPFMKASLNVYPLTSRETQLEFQGNYEPPMGILGSAADAVVGNRVAEATIHQFIKDVARYLRSAL